MKGIAPYSVITRILKIATSEQHQNRRNRLPMPPRKKHTLDYNKTMYKELLAFASTPENKEGTQDAHDDLLSAWGICQSVFGAQAKPEHAIALMPLLQDALDKANTPEVEVSTTEDDDEDDEDEDDEDDEEDEEEPDPEQREVIDMPAIDPPARRRRRARTSEH